MVSEIETLSVRVFPWRAHRYANQEHHLRIFATLAVAICSEYLVDSIEGVTEEFGLPGLSGISIRCLSRGLFCVTINLRL